MPLHSKPEITIIQLVREVTSAGEDYLRRWIAEPTVISTIKEDSLKSYFLKI